MFINFFKGLVALKSGEKIFFFFGENSTTTTDACGNSFRASVRICTEDVNKEKYKIFELDYLALSIGA